MISIVIQADQRSTGRERFASKVDCAEVVTREVNVAQWIYGDGAVPLLLAIAEALGPDCVAFGAIANGVA